MPWRGLLPNEFRLADGIYSGRPHLVSPFRKPIGANLDNGVVRSGYCASVIPGAGHIYNRVDLSKFFQILTECFFHDLKPIDHPHDPYLTV